MSVVVLCPMSIEHAAVSREMRRAGLSRVPVVRTGIGREAVVRAFEREFDRHGRGALYVLAGACGGLRATEDVPPIAKVIDEHGRCLRPFGAADDRAGVTLVGVDRIVATPADKRALAEATGAAVVDMETHAFASACEERGAAWSVVRGVSDTPDQTLPPEVLGWVTPEGGTRGVRAAADLARKPSLLPHVVGVVRRANRVLPEVGRRVVALARAWTERCAAAPAGEGCASRPCTAPIPIGADATAAIFFGGTFDPPHVGHVELARRVREWYEQRFDARGTAWLVYVPAARSPHKDEKPAASGAERAAMLRAALGGGGESGGPVERAVVWEDELGRGDAGPSYTVDTLERARAWLDAHGRVGVRMRLLIGADQAAQFHRWRSARRVIELAEPLVMARDGDADSIVSALGESGFWTKDELEAWRGRVVPVGTIEASSTAVRGALREGRAADAARMLPGAVARYIEERGLYRP